LLTNESPGSQLMLWLTTFGGLRLGRGDALMSGAATQRRRLALLSLLAVAGRSGMSREKLLAFLWPETDEAKARHTLNQLLYAQRKVAGDAPLFEGRKNLRINPLVMTSDVAALGEATGRGDLERAVDINRGAFLDGFSLPDAPEFDRWMEVERASFR